MGEVETRNLVVCCDGTWNTEDQTDASGLPIPTNVMKLYGATVRDDAQLAYYHPGVGTSGGWFQRKLDGATGRGLIENVKAVYTWLALHYAEGDHVFIFGFSRGAYTARMLAAVIIRSGLLDLKKNRNAGKSDADLVDALFELDKHNSRQSTKLVPGAAYFDVDASGLPKTEIWFVGVWDTVGSMGIPRDVDFLSWLDRRDRFQFRDCVLSDRVRHARHAVALDENRIDFLPTLWDTPAPGTHLSFKQIWFPGAHSDVGGGYAETGLSDGSLQWMFDEARDAQCGLRLNQSVVDQLAPCALAPQHNSRIGVFLKRKPMPRSTPLVDAANTAGDLDPSAAARAATPPISQGRYWPERPLPPGGQTTAEIRAIDVWAYTGIFLEAGADYTFSAKGEWTDGGIVSEPSGRATRKTISFRVRAFGGGVATALQFVLRRLCHNQELSIPFAKRFPGAQWFSLIGVIANGRTGDATVPNESFRIGGHASHRPVRSGYLYCYANDSWGTYANNRGMVELTVSRAGAAAAPASPAPAATIVPPAKPDGSTGSADAP